MVELYEGEKIELSMRKHWLVFTLEAIGLIVGAILPLAIYFILIIVTPEFIETLSTPTVIFSFSAWLLFMWFVFLIIFTNYYLDQIVVTNKRIIDIEQIGLFSRDIATTSINRLQDIKVELSGIFPTLLKYGDLHIQSAGAHKEILIKGIKHPEKVKEVILRLYHSSNHSGS